MEATHRSRAPSPSAKNLLTKLITHVAFFLVGNMWCYPMKSLLSPAAGAGRLKPVPSSWRADAGQTTTTTTTVVATSDGPAGLLRPASSSSKRSDAVAIQLEETSDRLRQAEKENLALETTNAELRKHAWKQWVGQRQQKAAAARSAKASAFAASRAGQHAVQANQASAVERQQHAAFKMPTKSDVAAALVAMGQGAKAGRHLECAPGFDLKGALSGLPVGYEPERIMQQYSTDHFPLGSPTECSWPMARTRVTMLLGAIAGNPDGGSDQCPEVGDWYEEIARRAPDGTTFCDCGFNAGSSSATFLHGASKASKMKSVVHAFDHHFPEISVALIRNMYGSDRLVTHLGDIRQTAKRLW